MNKILSFFKKNSKYSGSEYLFYIMTYYGYPLGLLVHVVFLIYFVQIDIMTMAYFNVFSIAVFFSGILFNNLGKVRLAFFIVTTEVVLHAFLSVYYLGYASGFQYYLFAMTILIVLLPKFNYIFKFVIFLIYLSLVLFFHQEYYYGINNSTVSQFAIDFIYFFNVIAAFSMFALIAYYYELAVRNQNNSLIEKNIQLDKLNSELKYSNDSKDKFFSIVAHDLKNPLSAIYMGSELISIYFDRFTQEQIKENIDKLHKSSKHLKDFLDNLLEWARSQTDGIEFSPEDINLLELINEIQNLLKSSADKKHQNMLVDCDENILLFADYNMLSTVIRNLLSNAIKFTPENGTIKIKVKVQDLVEISVIDSGIGMPPETVEKLFKIDESKSTQGTDGEKGTGLGLLLCKEFIEKHGGSIKVESELGKGTTFKVFISQKKH